MQAMKTKRQVQIKWVATAEQLTHETADEYLSDCDGISGPRRFWRAGASKAKL